MNSTGALDRGHETVAGTGPSAVGVALGVSGAAAGLWVVVLVGLVQVSWWLTPRPEPAQHPRIAAAAAGPMLSVDQAMHGREVFETTCATCHGSSGLGKQGLGRSLVHSDFVADRSAAELVSFIANGRAADDPLNVTGVAMPARGGNASLTDQDLAAVVEYLRGLQDPRRMPDLPAYVAKPVQATEAEKAKALEAAGGDAELAEFIASGNALFSRTCAACHGPGGVGVKGNGKPLVNNEFVRGLNDDELLAFIQRGRDPSDPKNTTGVGMPAKGGNPALSEDDLLDIIAYIRTLQPARTGAGGKN
ncbi:MAG: cytochrome c [Phycisphaerales bacterium]